MAVNGGRSGGRKRTWGCQRPLKAQRQAVVPLPPGQGKEQTEPAAKPRLQLCRPEDMWDRRDSGQTSGTQDGPFQLPFTHRFIHPSYHPPHRARLTLLPQTSV